MTAIIEINGTALSEFIVKFVESIGVDNFIIILFLLFLWFLIDNLQHQIKRDRREVEWKLHKFYHKKLSEAKTKEDFRKLKEFYKKNEKAIEQW